MSPHALLSHVCQQLVSPSTFFLGRTSIVRAMNLHVRLVDWEGFEYVEDHRANDALWTQARYSMWLLPVIEHRRFRVAVPIYSADVSSASISSAHAASRGASGGSDDASLDRSSTPDSMPGLTMVPYTPGTDTSDYDTTASESHTQAFALPRFTAGPLVADDDTDVWSSVAGDCTPRARSNSSDASGYVEPEYDLVPDEVHEDGESESGCETDVPSELADTHDFYGAKAVLVRTG